jgi:hypothetical protein
LHVLPFFAAYYDWLFHKMAYIQHSLMIDSYSGPAGGDGEAQGDVPVPGPDWPPAGLRVNQPGGR